MNAAVLVLVGTLGASFASFAEVLADRLPQGKKPLGRSHCEKCGRILNWFELVPIFSWLVLYGKCRTCGSSIPIRHFLVEAGLGLAFVAAAATLPTPWNPWTLAVRYLLLSALTVVVIADLRFFIIPDLVSLGLVAIFSVATLSAWLWPESVLAVALPETPSALWGMFFGTAFLAMFSIISRGAWMGWGDVKLAAGLGMIFGFPDILFNLAFAFIAGALVGIVLILFRRRGTRDLLPFGPFIVLGALPFIFGYSQAIQDFFGVSDFLLLFQ